MNKELKEELTLIQLIAEQIIMGSSKEINFMEFTSLRLYGKFMYYKLEKLHNNII
jgi:hypothetical protein